MQQKQSNRLIKGQLKKETGHSYSVAQALKSYPIRLLKEDLIKYIENQQRFVDIAYKSTVPTIIINTDDLNWDRYSGMILDKIR